MSAPAKNNRAPVVLKNIIPSFRGIKATHTITSWVFIPQWENTGAADAVDRMSHTSCVSVERPITEAFDFPDVGDVAFSVPAIAPGEVVQGALVELPVELLEKARNGTAYIYLWGWTDYNHIDAASRRRRTEFCVKIDVEGDLRSEDCQFKFREQPWHNGINDCCLRSPRPYFGTRCFKFLDTTHIDSVILGGTIIVSSLSHFRSLEETGCWGKIADDLEGSSLLTVKQGLIVTENSPELELVNKAGIGLGMFGKFANISGGGSLVMAPGVGFIHRAPEVFSYSASAGDLGRLTKAMCVDAKRRYNACLEITDLAKLRARIFEEGQIVEHGCKVSDMFHPGRYSRLYTRRAPEIY